MRLCAGHRLKLSQWLEKHDFDDLMGESANFAGFGIIECIIFITKQLLLKVYYEMALKCKKVGSGKLKEGLEINGVSSGSFGVDTGSKKVGSCKLKVGSEN